MVRPGLHFPVEPRTLPSGLLRRRADHSSWHFVNDNVVQHILCNVGTGADGGAFADANAIPHSRARSDPPGESRFPDPALGF